jgi:hypothetical protein
MSPSKSAATHSNEDGAHDKLHNGFFPSTLLGFDHLSDGVAAAAAPLACGSTSRIDIASPAIASRRTGRAIVRHRGGVLSSFEQVVMSPSSRIGCLQRMPFDLSVGIGVWSVRDALEPCCPTDSVSWLGNTG